MMVCTFTVWPIGLFTLEPRSCPIMVDFIIKCFLCCYLAHGNLNLDRGVV
jgi:hypothetical protein